MASDNSISYYIRKWSVRFFFLFHLKPTLMLFHVSSSFTNYIVHWLSTLKTSQVVWIIYIVTMMWIVHTNRSNKWHFDLYHIFVEKMLMVICIGNAHRLYCEIHINKRKQSASSKLKMKSNVSYNKVFFCKNDLLFKTGYEFVIFRI